MKPCNFVQKDRLYGQILRYIYYGGAYFATTKI